MSPAPVVAVKSTRIAMAKPNKSLNPLSGYLDHTLLKPDLTAAQVQEGCQHTIDHQFAGICLPPVYVKHANEQLNGYKAKVVTVIGFPLGYQKIGTKTEEARLALDDGADEVDMVLNISAFKSGLISYVNEDIDSIVQLTHFNNKLVKVIIETALLSEQEIIEACRICANNKVDYVKTCTGFNGGQASTQDVQLMHEHLPVRTKIKASGGIKDTATAWSLIESGADRLGTSSSLSLVAHAKE